MTVVLTTQDLVVRKGGTPITMEAHEGLTIVQTRRESGGSRLAMALADRFKPHSGTVDGPGFKRTALAGADFIDNLERQVSVRETIREQVAWAQPFFSWVPKDVMGHKLVEPWLEPVRLEDLDPDKHIGDLGVMDRFRLRILLALVSRPEAELLVVDDVDQVKKMPLRHQIMDDLEVIAEHVPVIVTTVNEEQ